MEIKTRKLFKELVKKLTMELLDEESIEEISTTANVEKQTGYNFVSEALDDKDLKQINKLIRDVVGDILRDIWLKRNAWK